MTSSETPGPYARLAATWWEQGLRGFWPVPGKFPPPEGVTGYSGIDPGEGWVKAWATSRGHQNIGWRIPADMIALDVDDNPEIGQHAHRTLTFAEADLGALPPTLSITARGSESQRRTYVYRIPEGLILNKAQANLAHWGPGIDILHRGHRYTIAPGSIHPELGTPYVVYGYMGFALNDEDFGLYALQSSNVADLPPAWVEMLTAEADERPIERSSAVLDLTPRPAPEFMATSEIRVFTDEQAQAFTAPFIADLRRAKVGEINTRLNLAALALSHFVPTYLSDGEARDVLQRALAETAYDGRTWRAESTIDSGLRAHSWAAQRPTEPPPFSLASVGVPGAEQEASAPPDESVVDALLAEMLDRDDLDNIPDPDPLVKRLLDRNTLARINGASNSGKSFVALDIAACIGGKLDWRGMECVGGTVLYVVAEGLAGMRKRVRAWEVVTGHTMTGVKFLPRPVQAMGTEWAVLVEACRRLRPVLIILDTQARVTVGVEENSSREMGVVINQMELLREASGACVMLVHHFGHGLTHGRGSTAFVGAVNTELTVERDGLNIDISVSKQKYHEYKDEPILELELKTVFLMTDGFADPDNTSAYLYDRDPSLALAPVSASVDKIQRIVSEIGKAFDVLEESNHSRGPFLQNELKLHIPGARQGGVSKDAILPALEWMHGTAHTIGRLGQPGQRGSAIRYWRYTPEEAEAVQRGEEVLPPGP
jgi:hypothetical protein